MEEPESLCCSREAHKLLVRAVATSHRDPTFVARMHALALKDSVATLEKVCQFATLDPKQAKLAHALLARLPHLLQAKHTNGDLFILYWTQEQVQKAPHLPSVAKSALVLFIDLLVHQHDLANEKHHLDDESNCADQTNIDSQHAANVIQPPLVGATSMIFHSILPHVSCQVNPATRCIALELILRVLTAATKYDTCNEVSIAPLPNSLLACVLSATLDVLTDEPRKNSVANNLARRCAQALVQMLLPRLSNAGPNSWLILTIEQWESLPWDVHLLIWPLLDRFHTITAKKSGGLHTYADQSRCSIGERFFEWMAKIPLRPEFILARAGGIASLPVRETLEIMRGKDSRCEDATLAALAYCLSVATPTEWRHAPFKLKSLLCSTAENLGFVNSSLEPKSHSIVQSSRTLLAALLCLCAYVDTGSRCVSEGNIHDFIRGFSNWLSDAYRSVDDQQVEFIAGLLTVTVRATAAVSSISNDPTNPFFILSLTLKRRLLELAQFSCPHASDIVQSLDAALRSRAKTSGSPFEQVPAAMVGPLLNFDDSHERSVR